MKNKYTIILKENKLSKKDIINQFHKNNFYPVYSKRWSLTNFTTQLLKKNNNERFLLQLESAINFFIKRRS